MGLKIEKIKSPCNIEKIKEVIVFYFLKKLITFNYSIKKKTKMHTLIDDTWQFFLLASVQVQL